MLAAGAEDCLDLPIEPNEIVARIETLLDASRMVPGAPAAILQAPRRLAALARTGMMDTDPDEELDLQWVVSSNQELVVSDSRTHPILSTNGAVADLNVIAYAGVPRSAVTGETIGSFCAIDGSPRIWSADELATLRDPGQLVNAYTALHQSAAVRPSLGSHRVVQLDRERGGEGLRRSGPAASAPRGHAQRADDLDRAGRPSRPATDRGVRAVRCRAPGGLSPAGRALE